MNKEYIPLIASVISPILVFFLASITEPFKNKVWEVLQIDLKTKRKSNLSKIKDLCGLIKVYGGDPILWLPRMTDTSEELYEYNGGSFVTPEKKARYSELKSNLQLLISKLYQLEYSYNGKMSNHLYTTIGFPENINSRSKELHIIQKYLNVIQKNLFISCHSRYNRFYEYKVDREVEKSYKLLKDSITSLEYILRLRDININEISRLKEVYIDHINSDY